MEPFDWQDAHNMDNPVGRSVETKYKCPKCGGVVCSDEICGFVCGLCGLEFDEKELGEK